MNEWHNSQEHLLDIGSKLPDISPKANLVGSKFFPLFYLIVGGSKLNLMILYYIPGESKWPFSPLVGCHLTFPIRSLIHPKQKALWITWYLQCIYLVMYNPSLVRRYFWVYRLLVSQIPPNSVRCFGSPLGQVRYLAQLGELSLGSLNPNEPWTKGPLVL